MFVCVCVQPWECEDDGVFLCDRRAGESGCQHVHPSQQHPALIDIECMFQAISQERRLEMTCLELCGFALLKEVVAIVFVCRELCPRLLHLMNTDSSRALMSEFFKSLFSRHTELFIICRQRALFSLHTFYKK